MFCGWFLQKAGDTALQLPVWCSSNTFDSISVVTLRWARLVPGWVTVFGQVNYLGAEPGTQYYLAEPAICGRLE